MKKIIIGLLSMFLLVGCQNMPNKKEIESYKIEFENIKTKEFISNEILDLIDDINEISNKYSKLDIYNEYVYEKIEPYESINYEFGISYPDRYQDGYFEEVIEKLDTTVSKGIKKYIEENKNNNDGEKKTAEFGRSIVIISDDLIIVKTRFGDIKDENIKKIITEINEKDYNFTNLKIGEKYFLVEVKNNEALVKDYNRELLYITYNLMVLDSDIQKVNIFVEQEGLKKFSENDKEVFKLILKEMKIDDEGIEEFVKEFEKSIVRKRSSKVLKTGKFQMKIIVDKANNKYDEKNKTYISIEKLNK